MAKLVQPIHFEDFDGSQFERLVFAYHARVGKWETLEWYGQVGADLGRDIWGSRKLSAPTGSICIQCVNRSRLTFAKATSDIAKIIEAPNGTPNLLRFVTRAAASAKLRDKIKQHAATRGIENCEIWSGPEFEEFLRRDAESILMRFVAGESFPDTPTDLITLGKTGGLLNDHEKLGLIAKLFDRPAFYTPIRDESSLPDFKKALTDTVQALGTGIWNTRDGHTIGRLPSRHDLVDQTLRDKLQEVEHAIARLRTEFDRGVADGRIRPCNCGKPDCPVFFIDHESSHKLEELRWIVLRLFQEAYPNFVPRPAW